jgi:hypothetical protein
MYVMRAVTLIIFISISTIVFSKNLTREVKLEFLNNCVKVSEENKNIIIDEYFKLGAGDWLYFTTITQKEMSENNFLAYKFAKIRNRAIGSFLKENGILGRQLIYKYSIFEQVWVHKPRKLKSSVSLNEIQNNKEVLTYSFLNKNGVSVQLPSGNVLEFKPHSFEGLMNDLITIKIKEYTSKQDFVKFGVTALGSHGMLETQGMYNIEAFKNDLKVKLKRNASYNLKILDGKTSEDFYSFYAADRNGELVWKKNPNQKFIKSEGAEITEEINIEEPLSIDETSGMLGKFGEFYEDADGNLQMALATSPNGMTYTERSYIEGTFLTGKFNQLGWINCDRFYQADETITMKIKIDKGISVKAYCVYVVFNDINSVLPVYQVSNGTYLVYDIPKGVNVTLVAVQAVDLDKFKLAFSELKTQEESVINLSSAGVNKTRLNQYLDDVIY